MGQGLEPFEFLSVSVPVRVLQKQKTVPVRFWFFDKKKVSVSNNIGSR